MLNPPSSAHVSAAIMRPHFAFRLGLCCCMAGLCFPGLAGAEPHARQPQPEDLLPESNLDIDDPIGVDAESRGLERDANERARANKPPPPAQVTAERARFGPQPPPIDARKGEVLTAGPSTREIAHKLQVKLEPGLCSVQIEMQFENRSQKPSELRYRLAVPEGSELTTLEVCNASGCRPGLPDANQSALGAYELALLSRRAGNDRALPIARAVRVHDARGAAILVHAAPVVQGSPLRVRLTYVSDLPLHGGIARFVLPARGMDPEAAPGEVSVSSAHLFDLRAAGQPIGEAAQSFDPWVEVAFSARAKNAEPAHAAAWSFACSPGRCARGEVWAGPQALSPVDLVIALDLSPSTEGPARGRLVAAVAALLEAAPEGSRVRAMAFAARARTLIEAAMDPAQVELAPFARAVAEAELGSATRFEAVWAEAAPWFKQRAGRRLRPLIVIIGDGGLTEGQAKPFANARALGVEVAALNLAERSVSRGLRAGVLQTGGIVIDAGAQAERAARGRDPAPLRERLSALFAPTLARASASVNGRRVELGPLRAGELLAWQGRAGTLALQYGSGRTRTASPAERGLSLALAARIARDADPENSQPTLTLIATDPRDLELATHADWPEPPKTHKAACDRRGPARSHSAISSDAQPVALAEERVCKPVPKAQVAANDAGAEIGSGMPSDPLLSMLRQRIMPIARGCFRRDRAGRAEYQKRAVFVFALAEREVVDAHVEGPIPDSLRRCLLAAVDTLEVPRFSGVVKARYPLVTESVPLPEQIDLQSETAGSLDRLFPGSEKP